MGCLGRPWRSQQDERTFPDRKRIGGQGGLFQKSFFVISVQNHFPRADDVVGKDKIDWNMGRIQAEEEEVILV